MGGPTKTIFIILNNKFKKMDEIKTLILFGIERNETENLVN